MFHPKASQSAPVNFRASKRAASLDTSLHAHTLYSDVRSDFHPIDSVDRNLSLPDISMGQLEPTLVFSPRDDSPVEECAHVAVPDSEDRVLQDLLHPHSKREYIAWYFRLRIRPKFHRLKLRVFGSRDI